MIPINKIFYTYKDYLTFDNDKSIEIIDGKLYNMASPSIIHQALSMEISYSITNYLKTNKKKCKVFTAPFDVILIDDTEDLELSSNIVIPDISIICDENKLSNGKRCVGSPDMIVEIISPSNASNDYVTKLYLYQKYKVNEYWIVSPQNKRILVYILNNDGYYNEPILYSFDCNIKVNIFDDLFIDFNSFDL